MKKWECTVCGYVHTGDTPPDTCPVCGADKSQFILLDETAAAPQSDAEKSAVAAKMTNSTVRQWRCTVCGYLHDGPEPPDQCPVCGADKSEFVPVEEEGDSSDQQGGVETPHVDKNSDNGGDGGIAAKLSHLLPAGRWEEISQQLTRLHGHPIAVHIPNGLLPISVFFTILALLFGSDGFATAARLNTIMVALAMPVVIGTGWVDWINRFGGRMSPVFRMKMICAGVVTGLSFILAIWWTVNPTLYLNGISGNFIFVLFNLVNLGAASVAGWYGGKLVFNK